VSIPGGLGGSRWRLAAASGGRANRPVPAISGLSTRAAAGASQALSLANKAAPERVSVTALWLHCGADCCSGAGTS